MNNYGLISVVQYDFMIIQMVIKFNI